MAQIYQEQVRVDRTPIAPDVSIMASAEGDRVKFAASIDHNIKIEFQRREKQAESLKDLTMMAAKQVYKNAETLYPNNQVKYKETVEKGLKPILDAVPNTPEKSNMMAELQIYGSGYDTAVKKGELDKQENIWKTRYRDSLMQSADNAIENIGKVFVAPNDMAKMTTEEIAANGMAYRDAELQLKKAYNGRYAVDRNGNPVMSDSERARLEDAWENRGFHSLVGYAQQNIQSNYNSVVDTADWLKSNKELAKKNYGYDDKTYEKTVKTMDSIIKGQMTPEQAQLNNRAETEVDGIIKAMDIKVMPDGSFTPKSRQFSNVQKVVESYNFISERENNYTGNREKLNQNKAKVGTVLVDMIERGQVIKGRIGKVATDQVNQNLDDLVDSMNITDTQEKIAIKAKMYSQTLIDLNAKKIHFNSNNENDVESAKETANRAYLKYAESVVGKIKFKEGDDPRLVVKEAVAKYSYNKSKENIQRQLQSVLTNRLNPPVETTEQLLAKLKP